MKAQAESTSILCLHFLHFGAGKSPISGHSNTSVTHLPNMMSVYRPTNPKQTHALTGPDLAPTQEICYWQMEICYWQMEICYWQMEIVSSKSPFVSSKSPVLGLGQVRLGHEFVWDSSADRRSCIWEVRYWSITQLCANYTFQCVYLWFCGNMTYYNTAYIMAYFLQVSYWYSWTAAVEEGAKVIYTNSGVCLKHFRGEDICVNLKRQHLRKGALPSLQVPKWKCHIWQYCMLIVVGL